MTPQFWIALGAILAGLGVAAGAFGAHGLQDRLSAEQLATFEVAVRYQMFHSIAIVLVGLIGLREKLPGLQLAGGSFLLGIVLFSGMLYLYLFSGVKTFALIVPIGGSLMILGWLALAIAALRSSRAVG
jgi:uncharacterized membrane protein YgdD (TMEM256/DUF423 family)